MDGIPESIWRDFPHPNGPNLGGRDHVPFTSFETILARQILSCSLDMRRSQIMDYHIRCRQDISLHCNISDERSSKRQRHPPTSLRGYEREDIVGTLGHKTLEMNGAFVELPVVDDDASTSGSESDIVQVQNPSFFSHRATVEDLIASFRRNTIGPLAGVEIRDDSADGSRPAPIIIISDKVSQRTLECALEKWRVEQEEKELEMRWRATKKVSENWLTKVELVREKHRARREKFEREREKRRMKAGGTAASSLTGKGPTMSQGNNRGVLAKPQPHSVLEPLPQPTAPTYPELLHSRLSVASPASHALPSTSQPTNDPAFPYGPLHSSLPSSSLTTQLTPVRTNPLSSIQTVPQEYTSPVSPKFSHTPYDPRTPDLALEDLAHIPPDSVPSGQTTFPENAILVPGGLDDITSTASMDMQQEEMYCVQQYIDLAQISQSPFPPPCVSPSQDTMLSTSLSSSIQNTLPEVVPVPYSGDSSAHCISRESHSHTHSIPNQETVCLSPFPVSPAPMTQDPSDATLARHVSPSKPTAEEKMMWHVWSLTQAPAGTAADVILRNPQASRQSNLAPMLFNLFPNFKGNETETARVKILTGSSSVDKTQHLSAALHRRQLAGTGPNVDLSWIRASLPSVNFPFDTSASSTLASRAVLINPAYLASQPPLSFTSSQSIGKHTSLQDPSTALPVSPSVSLVRPTPVLNTQDLPLSLPLSWSHVDSPMSPTSAHTSTTAPFAESSELSNSPSALYPQYMPMGNRLFRIARVADADVLRPSYWFEPDSMATERMRNVVNLMERSAGWRRPERRTRVFRGDRKARGPDDLATFDLCFGY